MDLIGMAARRLAERAKEWTVGDQAAPGFSRPPAAHASQKLPWEVDPRQAAPAATRVGDIVMVPEPTPDMPREGEDIGHPEMKKNIGRHPEFLRHKGRIQRIARTGSPEAMQRAAVGDMAGGVARKFQAAEEVTPPGGEKLVKGLKRHTGGNGITNPYALAWWMKGEKRGPWKPKRKKEATAATAFGQLMRPGYEIPPEAAKALVQRYATNSALSLYSNE